MGDADGCHLVVSADCHAGAPLATPRRSVREELRPPSREGTFSRGQHCGRRLLACVNSALVASLFFLAAFAAHAGEIGHFNGGVMNMRDYLLPDPGFYTALYSYFYTTDRLNDS